MSFNACHKPPLWELFRNESQESQNRRAAILRSHALVNRDRRSDTCLWWDKQRHVDQVVPAEFVNPKDIDTSTYRYQVFARPPPLQCYDELQNVTEGVPPIRYNVKRVAIDKPLVQAPFECAGHWTKRPFALQCKVQGGDGGQCDMSKNNNTQPLPLEFQQTRSINSSSPLPGGEIENISCKYSLDNKPLDQNKNALKTAYETYGTKPSINRLSIESIYPYKTTSDLYDQKSLSPLNESNSRASLCPSHISDLKQRSTHRPSTAVKPQGIAVPVLQTGSFGIKSEHQVNNTQSRLCRAQSAVLKSSSQRSQLNKQPAELASNCSSHKLVSLRPRQMSAGPCRPSMSNSSLMSDTSATLSRHPSPVDSHRQNENMNRSSQDHIDVTHKKSSLNLVDGLGRPKASCSKSSIQSRASSVSSCSTWSRSRSVQKSWSPRFGLRPLPTSALTKGQKRHLKPSSSGESVASLLSDGCHVTQTIKSQKPLRSLRCMKDSVQSLLSDTNQNNIYVPIEVALNSVQDLFKDITLLPALTQGCIFLKNVTDSCLLQECRHDLVERQKPMHIKIKSKLPNCSDSKNNNALVGYANMPGHNLLRCCPIQPCREGLDPCDQRPQKMLCQSHGKRLNVPDGQQHIYFDHVQPINQTTGKVNESEEEQRFKCKTQTSCTTGEMLEGPGGPVLLCQPVQEQKGKIGYRTYKIVGGIQRREPPMPNYSANLRLPPDLEEYREFTRRCPKFTMSRYDRTNPQNEMLLSANRVTSLLGDQLGPFAYFKLSNRNLPPLFQPLQTKSDLSWNLPSYVVTK